MNNKEFIKEIVNLYRSARDTKYPIGFRGRSHTISSYVEDLFWYYLWINNSIDSIYIDQPLSVEWYNKIIYPDIITVNSNSTITNFFDLKMDLWWMRDKLVEYAIKYEELINSINNKECKLKIWTDKAIKKLTIWKNVKFNIVVISWKNISKNKLEENINEFEKHNFKNVNLMVLTNNIHPNEYWIDINDVIDQIDINTLAFDKINNLNY